MYLGWNREYLSHMGQDIIDKAEIPLGRVATPRNRLLVFPNSHIHRVTKMHVSPHAPRGVYRRRIVVFFLVDPNVRIVSTSFVADQRQTMTLERAQRHRLALMQERKFHKGKYNLRHLNLCEH